MSEDKPEYHTQSFLSSSQMRVVPLRGRIGKKPDPGDQSKGPVQIVEGGEIFEKNHAPVQWAVNKILPEGVTLLAGKPKTRKSFLALGIAMAVVNDTPVLGQFSVAKGSALYLAMEDNERRLTKRMRLMSDQPPEKNKLWFATDWRRIGAGGIEDLEAWLKERSDARLIVIDTLARIRADRQKGGNAYDEDYDVGKALIDLCKAHHVAILLIHHARKAESEDPVDLISGTLGLVGGVDGFWVLQKTLDHKDGALLHVDGRDIDDPVDLPLEWDQESVQWLLADDPARIFRLSKQHLAVLDVLKAHGGAMAPVEIGVELGIERDAWKDAKERQVIKRALKKLSDLDLVRGGRFDGKYEIKPYKSDNECF